MSIWTQFIIIEGIVNIYPELIIQYGAKPLGQGRLQVNSSRLLHSQDDQSFLSMDV